MATSQGVALRVKPANLTYGVDEKPPVTTSVLLAVQHVCMMAIGLVIPVALMRVIDAPNSLIVKFLSLSMIAAGIGTILQSVRWGPVGSGYLSPETPDPTFLSVALLAVQTGGMSLLFGMTIITGIFECLLAPLLYRLRAWFPTEVTGVVVVMVGVSIIPLTLRDFVGMSEASAQFDRVTLWIGISTLLVLIGCSVWGNEFVKRYALLIGFAFGYATAFFTGRIGAQEIAEVQQAAYVALPTFKGVSYTVRADMLLPFLVAITSSAVKNVGDITTCQKINDAAWRRPDMETIRGGVLADGICTICGGLMGGMGQASNSANIGLSLASGVTSRVIGYFTGGLIILLGFSPKLAAVLTIIPNPVMGALLLFAISFMIVAGLEIVSSRMLDARKTFIIGMGLIFGLGAGFDPQLFAGLGPMWKPIFESTLSVAMIAVVLMNLLMRIGISRKATITLAPDPDSMEKSRLFLERQGEVWGARRQVMERAISAASEFLDNAVGSGALSGPVELQATFDELNLDLEFRYEGKAAVIPTESPDPQALLAGDRSFHELSGFLIGRLSDGATTSQVGTQNILRLHYDH